ncbi:SIR2-like domain-containing protein [Bacillus sp. OV166]|uniref:DUF4020 domain-containing protein n=1 Tax=Bacillus sp. OV166 TaxID=1882763 RepID=UPI000A2AC7C5|nr:DUF4020 domain-containing protein [Bacillus sp. OV166]SMQ81260.1 SIR2-like domain-containing protein [Bacillus sp. OV166]
MWINKEVNMPEELLSAQKNGKLVIFAGAGVSMGFPANFPSFYKLADDVATYAGTFKLEEHEPIDHYLGRLVNQRINVHEIVRNMLTNPESKPTVLHHSLFSLFPNQDDIKIVTTNFDLHFSTVNSGVVEEYRAPVLPLGNNFNGIVYLHGNVNQIPRNLILTDGDFGRAYLTEGWATRFLHSMFDSFVVLFVGYSHNDLIMNYLARGLPPNTQRFAFTLEGTEEHWSFLDIEPIIYPKREKSDSHGALGDAINSWIKLSNMDFFEHEKRIKLLVETTPSLAPEDTDYLIKVIKDIPTLRFFVKYARGPLWIKWLEEKGFLYDLFVPNRILTEDKVIICKWIVENFILEDSEEFFSLIERNGQKINSVLWNEIAHKLSFTEKLPEPDILTKWVGLLLKLAPLQTNKYLDYILYRLKGSQYKMIVILLFDYLSRPQLLLKPHFQITEKRTDKLVDIEVSIKGDHYYLSKTWDENIKPNLNEFANLIEPIITNNIRMAHFILNSSGQANSQWDPISFDRHAIEPHEQDRYPRNFDVIINSSRDIINYFCLNNPEIALYLIESWFLSDVPLMKRISIYGLSKVNLNSDIKINWLIEKNVLYTFGLKHEVYQVLKFAYPVASYKQRDRLFKKILIGPEVKQEENIKAREYEIYNLIYWLSLVSPDCEIGNKYLKEFRNKYPTFIPRDNPDLHTWSSIGNIEHLSPLSVDEMLKENIENIFDLLLKFEGDWFNGPDREGLLEEVGKAAKQNFEWSWHLTETLISKQEITSDLWRAVFKGWNLSHLDQEKWEKIIILFETEKELSLNFKDDIIDLFTKALKSQDNKSFINFLDRAEIHIYYIWKEVSNINRQSQNNFTTDSSLNNAINNFGGKSVLFWLNGLTKRLEKEEGKNSRKLFDRYRSYFNEVLSNNSYTAQLGKVLLASQIHFLYSLDSIWVRENILPLLDWSTSPHQAAQAWDGYLSWGKIITPLLEETMVYYEQSYNKLSESLKHIRNRFCEHLAYIAVNSDVLQENNNQQLIKFVGSIEEKDRVSWTNFLNSNLEMIKSNEAKTTIWNKWIKGYWEQRILGAVPLSKEEVEKMLQWSIQLEPVFDEVVDKIINSPIPSLEHTYYYNDLESSNIIEKFPKKVIELLEYLLSATVDPFYNCSVLENIVKKLRLAINGEDELLRPVRLQLSRLGCNIS